ncbi:MAG: DUF4352 domain-containing protein [Rubrobacter sp.]|nr:DUF4352 domain-containing protein [Rubrobacter sp.]
MRRKKLASMVFLAVVAVFVAGCGGEQTSDSSADNQGGADQTTGSTEQSAASIGDPVTVGNVQWTVTKGEWSDVLVSERWGNDEGNFVILDVDLLNNSNQDLRLATPFLVLVDSKGREFEPDVEMNAFHLWGEENMFVGKIEPGTKKQGRVIFPIESDSSGLKLRVGEAKFGSNETRDIDLGTLPKAY